MMSFFTLKRHRLPQQPATQTGVITNGHSLPQSRNIQNASGYTEYCSTLGIDIEKGTTSFSERIRRDYRWHTAQYWFVASLANGLLWIQIVLGAAMTALGASSAPGSKTAIIYLGASSTVISGFLTYFKSRNQPNRARQFRQALRDVRNKMDEYANDLGDSTSSVEAHRRAHEVIQMYDNALAEAAANYPDFWVTIADFKKWLPGTQNDNGTKVPDPTSPQPEPGNKPTGQPLPQHSPELEQPDFGSTNSYRTPASQRRAQIQSGEVHENRMSFVDDKGQPTHDAYHEQNAEKDPNDRRSDLYDATEQDQGFAEETEKDLQYMSRSDAKVEKDAESIDFDDFSRPDDKANAQHNLSHASASNAVFSKGTAQQHAQSNPRFLRSYAGFTMYE